ncbi:phenylalanine--tRNA ligase subunit beta [Nafulsella turpanensis]|uniref:phenylalanine--tRNA ligase subunit beta n=1 Tax=Nafulsella turpanensis TaxID=1265690 RepID=UPI00034572F5|nr:phenylalanine--tRNA ligase subunit beta [Nafulsella turpanensis]
MRISLNWLKKYISFEHSAEEIAALLTASGLEVEGIERAEKVPGGLEGMVIGEVLSCEKHPNADKLSITTVDIGSQVSPIVCGAPNVAAGQKVVIATVGSTLYPAGGEPFKIKKAKIRGEVSEGMICAEDEIGLGSSHAGIMVLDTHLPNGTPAAQYFQLESEEVLEIGLTPNRADAASHMGVARELKALLNRPLQLPSVDAFKVENTDHRIEVEVQNLEACPRYSGLTISDVEVKESPEWLRNRLLSIGLQPINNIVDVTNFVLHELGQPLHAFDTAAIKGDKVVIRTLPQGAAFTTLDEKERKLQAEDLMICNAEEGMCIAGVFGGHKSGVKESTKAIFLESAYFSPDWIRRTAQHHSLKTDASFRYERGADPNITVYALKRAALLIKKVAGGYISSEITDIYPQKVEDFRIETTYSYINQLIGKDIPAAETDRILESLDIKLTDKTAEGFTALVPPYRVDVQRPADLVEEVLRVYGYDNIETSETLSSSYLAAFPALDENLQQRRISELLAANGFLETITNSLTKPEYAQEVDFIDKSRTVEILNKLSEDLGVMRQSLLFGGLEVIAHNINRRQRDLKLFEFGKTYQTNGDGFEEKKFLGIWLSGNAGAEHYLQASRPVAFQDIRLAVEKIFGLFGIREYDTQVIHEKGFAYGTEIMYNGRSKRRRGQSKEEPLARLGKVAPALATLAGVKQEVFWAEVSWAALLEAYKEHSVTYQPISKFPEVRRDLSLVIDKKVQFEDISKITNRQENSLIKRVGVFDVYEGDKLEEGKKAYALSFILQDEEKTLTDKVIDKVMQRLIKTFEDQLGAVIRK